jgi:hypothetical protein
VRFLCIATFLAMQACSHQRLCEIAPVPPFVILPETAPTGLVRGVVVALPDSSPLPYARVRLDGTDAWAITDAEGRFALTSVRPGALALLVQMINYGIARVPLEMPPDRGVTVRIPLVRHCFQMQPIAN